MRPSKRPGPGQRATRPQGAEPRQGWRQVGPADNGARESSPEEGGFPAAAAVLPVMGTAARDSSGVVKPDVGVPAGAGTMKSMEERELYGQAFRSGTLVCDEVVVTERLERRLVPVDIPGTNRRDLVDRSRRHPPTIRFEGELEATFARELERLAGGARDHEERRRQRDEGFAVGSIDLVLDEDRNLIGCSVGAPLNGFGAVSQLDFGVGHAEL